MPILLFSCSFAEASCAAAIRTARDFVADVGEAAAGKSGSLLDLAKRNPKNRERDCERLMSKRLGLTIPIRKGFLKTKSRSLRIPFLRFRDWLLFLIQNNCTHILAGLVKPNLEREGDIWEAFWRNFQKQSPEHPIFQKEREGEVCLRRCVAILLHGDEGRSKKRLPFLVLNLHGPLGRGAEPGMKSTVKKKYLKMLVNFKGHSYTNLFLVSAIAKAGYSGKNSYVFDLLLKTVTEELAHVANVGVQAPGGERWWAFCLGVVGDWPWLAKCGLERSFMNVPKHKAHGDSRPDCRGICHLCSAGQCEGGAPSDFPFEQIQTKNPLWAASLLQESPFSEPSPFEAVPHVFGELATLFRFDLFHCWHLGVAKNFLGSMLALLSDMEAESTVDRRFESLTSKYLEWCKANHKQAHCQKITKEHVNWNQGYPTGSWHKGDLSTSLMLWVEARFRAEDWSGQDPLLVMGGQAAIAINSCLKLLYNSGAWLESDQAKLAAEYGLKFLRRYAQMAIDAHSRALKHFLLMPKAHALHHLWLELFWASAKGRVLSPLAFSVQMDEDYIGRGSRLSRHVHSARCEERVVSRHLQAVYSAFVDAGYLIRASGSWTLRLYMFLKKTATTPFCTYTCIYIFTLHTYMRRCMVTI